MFCVLKNSNHSSSSSSATSGLIEIPEDCGVQVCFDKFPLSRLSMVNIGSFSGLSKTSNSIKTLGTSLSAPLQCCDKNGSETTLPEPKIPLGVEPTFAKNALSPGLILLWLLQLHIKVTLLVFFSSSIFFSMYGSLFGSVHWLHLLGFQTNKYAF